MTIKLQDMLDQFRNGRPTLAKVRLYVSSQFMADLKTRTVAPPNNGLPFAPLGGVPIIETPALPVTVRDVDKPIVQHDPFAEYGPDDMHWAEPLGLATYPTQVIHCVQWTEDADVPERRPQEVVDEFVFRCSL